MCAMHAASKRAASHRYDLSTQLISVVLVVVLWWCMICQWGNVAARLGTALRMIIHNRVFSCLWNGTPSENTHYLIRTKVFSL
jgi:hypothetical protein